MTEESIIKDLEDKARELEDRLMMAYCKEIGSDSTVGLSCCDNYRDWVESLPSAIKQSGE